MGTMVKVRYIHSGQAIGFENRILASISTPDRMLFLSYPQDAEKFDLRKTKRFPLLLPAIIIKNQLETNGIIKDFSRDGIQFISKKLSHSSETSFEKGDEITILSQFIGLSGKQTFKGIIKSLSIDYNSIRVGIQFKDIQDDMKEKIDQFIIHLSKHFE